MFKPLLLIFFHIYSLLDIHISQIREKTPPTCLNSTPYCLFIEYIFINATFFKHSLKMRLIALHNDILDTMGDVFEQYIDYVGLQPESIVGKETVIEPFHVIKYCLREGAGAPVQPGMTIYCFNNIYLIDGTQVVKGHRITKYLFGRNRLIQGLQLGLQGVKKHEKLRLVISGEYAYQDQDDIKLIPPNSKLIFEIDVVDISRISPDKMSDAELYYEVYHNLDLSAEYLEKKDEQNGLLYIREAYSYAKKIKHYRCVIQGKILLKWGNILYQRGEYTDSLAVISQIERYNSDLFEDILRLQIKLLQALDRQQELQRLIESSYNQNIHSNSIKRICVQYYKQTKNKQKLNRLQGYNAKKDRFSDMSKYQNKNMYMSMYF